jgi:hypothetical protein
VHRHLQPDGAGRFRGFNLSADALPGNPADMPLEELVEAPCSRARAGSTALAALAILC